MEVFAIFIIFITGNIFNNLCFLKQIILLTVFHCSLNLKHIKHNKLC